MMYQLIEDFKISLIKNGKSPKIIESYDSDIKVFIEFLGIKEVEFNGNLQDEHGYGRNPVVF